MAQIIQYKDRERDTSVYPVTVGAAVYMDFKDSSTYQTLDDVMAIKPDSIIIYDASVEESAINGYTSLLVNIDQSLTETQQAIALQNLGIQDIVNNWRDSILDITLTCQNKQDKIVSFEHIKTINNVNIVGPGNVTLYEGFDIIGLDSSLDKDSSNAIMNSTVTNKFNELEDYVTTQDSSIINYVTTQDSSIINSITWENITKE